MKGDFSRIRFNPAKQYTAVLKQQGRVDLDADANEQCAIDLTLRQTINTDVIGEYGGPENGAGFAIEIDGDQIWIGPGRYYVHGILVENDRWMNYDDQPHLIDPTSTGGELLNQLLQAGANASLGFVLEVWQRLATALDDPCLLEPALGQADTTARLQTVWRVVGSAGATTALSPSQPSGTLTLNLPVQQPIEINPIEINPIDTFNPVGTSENSPIAQLSPCCQALYPDNVAATHTGEMGAGLAQAGSDCGCQPIAGAGYQGLENQLYRVEIHTRGDLTSATFKWSRENGSVVTQVTGVGANSPVITVASLGPDANLGFQTGQWVELSDDTYQFGETPNQPGLLFQIAFVNQATLQVTMSTPVFGIDPTKNARMRRWDQSGASATAFGIPVSGKPILLENGIQVDFKKGDFEPGDYWTIPARTASGQIDWPPCGSNDSHYQPSSYMRVYCAPLACAALRRFIQKGTTGALLNDRFQTSDCRLLFPPLTAVNADATAAALHVSAISWVNDDVVTTDTLLEQGLSVTFDQATTCPWGGGNFQVTIEPPYGLGSVLALQEGKLAGVTKPTFNSPAGTDSFVRTVFALDPPWGITVSGNQVIWFAPVSNATGVNYGAFEVLGALNTMLSWQTPIGYARVRVRLIGGAIYGSGASGNIYLDGQSFGQTGARSMDGSQDVNYTLPSGNSLKTSDYEGWFYLAPTVYVTSVVIQGLQSGQETTISALKILVNSNNQILSFQIGETATVTNLQASITLSYPPIAPVVVTLTLTGAGVGSIVSIASSVTIPTGQQTVTTPINILANPGAVTDVVTLIASVATAVTTLPVATQPTLSITGMAPPPPPIQ
jgi:Family of unknown function (DUF6519)